MLPSKDDPLALFLDALLFVYKYALVSLTEKSPISILPFSPKSEISLPPFSPFPFSLIIWLGLSYQNCFKPVGLNWGLWMDFKSNSPETTDKALWIYTFGRENVCFIDHWCSTMANRVTASCYCVPSSQHELQVAPLLEPLSFLGLYNPGWHQVSFPFYFFSKGMVAGSSDVSED